MQTNSTTLHADIYSRKLLCLDALPPLQGTIVLCAGIFDIVHPGHIEHLMQAKAMGDTLIVAITSDQYTARQKGPGKPVFSAEQRARQIAALEVVDYVCINDSPNAILPLTVLRPAVYCKGPDYASRTDGTFFLERRTVEQAGGRIAFTAGATASSSALLNGHDEMKSRHDPFIQSVRERHGFGTVVGWLDRAAQLKALCIGEPIIDVYTYVTAAGKSAKESIITFRYRNEERFQGGGYIITNHLAQVCANSTFWCGGMKDIEKRRYVEEPFVHKVFSVATEQPYVLQDAIQIKEDERRKYDLLVISDFGHGLIPDEQAASRLCREYGMGQRPYTALTVQSNSLNWGYNTLRKWTKADFVVVDEEELRMASGSPHWAGYDLRWWIVHEYRRLGAKAFCVTRGHNGALFYTGADNWCEAPPLATVIEDRMGAGDAFLAYAAPLAAVGAPPEVVVLVGSVASGIKVGMRGNQTVQKRTVLKWLKSMLA